MSNFPRFAEVGALGACENESFWDGVRFAAVVALGEHAKF